MNRIFTKKNIESILNQVDEGIQIIDSQGKIVYCNEAAAKLDNINKEEAFGKHILEIYPSLTEESSTLLQVLKGGNATYNLEQTFVNYKGYKITTINSTIPIMEGKEVVGALEISKDITKVKELSEKLVDLQKQLYKEDIPHKEQKRGTAKYTFRDIIGQSKNIQKLKERALKAANTLSAIIVYGNTGTGKELIVQSIHNVSERRTKPFIAQNCAAIPAALLESILFGTVKGSFTGAEHRPGLFELANGGTLFLDEINSMPIELQAKLLRVLEEGCIRRVGDIRTREVNVRIITAMNMEPIEAVEKKYLRNDLFYRLNVVSLKMPDLKERREDIPLLVEYFIKKFEKKLNKKIKGITPQVMQIFLKYQWLGNVRELENIIEGAMNVLEGESIGVDDLPYYLQNLYNEDENTNKKLFNESNSMSLKNTLGKVEKDLIVDAMHKTQGNISSAAEILEIPRQTLQYKLQKYKIK